MKTLMPAYTAVVAALRLRSGGATADQSGKQNPPAPCVRFPLCKRGIEGGSRRARGPSFVSLLLLILTLTACKIDLTVIGIGTVKTDTGTFDCANGTGSSTSIDCQQQYVTDKTQCVGYEVGPPEVIPANCTLVTTSVNETFTALPGDNSNFGGWGNFCFDLADLSCRHTIAQVDAENQQQVDITATFDPERAPQDATYTYNHLGHRASKTVAGVKTHFVYSDIDGQLLGEYKSNGDPIREYVYLEGERVAMYDYTTVEPRDSSTQKAIVYLHNDHVGQVQFAFNSDGQMIYERIQTPFGETMGEMNVYNVQVPVRFPGQYYDSESGFNQNWHRDYDPALGRYVQSDPIGLRGGVNTYIYVENSPIVFFDDVGLRGKSYRDKNGHKHHDPAPPGPLIFPDGATDCKVINDNGVASDCDCKTGEFEAPYAPPANANNNAGSSDSGAGASDKGNNNNSGPPEQTCAGHACVDHGEPSETQ